MQTRDKGGAASDPSKINRILTRGCYHALPLLEKAGLEAVSGAEAVGLVARHELLHGLEDHTELGANPGGSLSRGRCGVKTSGMEQKERDQRLTRR